ncbi:CBS domain-containing protein [Candidatus Woesearchaeota archaeon]|nr:CBS domain-containing protein [Candidatus Woesearchaeota archaeon]
MVEKHLIKKGYVAVDKKDSVSKLIGQLDLHNAKAALVFDKKKFLGVADTHLLVRTKLDPTEMKIAKIVKPVPPLTGKESIEETVRLMFTAETRILPVIQNSMVIGIVASKDLIQELNKTKFANDKITKIMSLTPITVHENERIGKAIYIMKEKNISRIPIVDEKGEIINIACLKDFLDKFILRQQSKTDRRGRGTLTQFGPRTIRAFKDKTHYDAYSVNNIATSVMITASPDDTLSRVLDKMERFDISSIVVVEGKKPVGIVTTRDLLRLFLKDLVTL